MFQIHICEEQLFFCKQLFDFGIKSFSSDIFFSNNTVFHLVLLFAIKTQLDIILSLQTFCNGWGIIYESNCNRIQRYGNILVIIEILIYE